MINYDKTLKSMKEEKWMLCEPSKNTECAKTRCQKSCRLTYDIRFAKEIDGKIEKGNIVYMCTKYKDKHAIELMRKSTDKKDIEDRKSIEKIINRHFRGGWSMCQLALLKGKYFEIDIKDKIVYEDSEIAIISDETLNITRFKYSEIIGVAI